MKNIRLLFAVASLFIACGRTEKTQERTNQTQTPVADTGSAVAVTPKNCRSVVETGQLGKTDVYQESAKPIHVALTVNQDESTTQTANGCYYNNTVTVLATKKSGSRVFKRTLLKDDLLYFTKSDDAIEQSILQKVLYKPTFNAQKYVTITMRLMEPGSKKTTDYTVFMNYFGEIVKVK